MNALKTFGFVFLIFFVMAFACKDENDSGGTDTPQSKQTTTNGGVCSTEAEFKAIITGEKMRLANKDDKYAQVIFNSFDVEGPMHYQNSQEYYFTNTDDAYRVTTDFDAIYSYEDRIYRDRYENNMAMCYTVTSRNTCVCFWEKGLPKERREDVTGQY